MHRLLIVGIALLLLTACGKENKYFSGYIDTDLVYLSADYSGRLTDLAVLRGQLVTKKQFLFKLEQTSEQYDVAISNLNQKDLLAQREQILTQLRYNEINYRRISGMQKQNAASQNDLDAARRDLNISKEQLNAIDVKIKNNEVTTNDKKWQMTRKENFAPQSGIVFDTYYTKGEFVQAGAPVLSLVTRDNIKAVFFVPEIKLSQLRLNQQVKIKTAANEDFTQGHINYISNIAEYTPPIIYSREERQRLVFRIEVKIDAPDVEKIHLGQPVTLELA
ncbi:hemolysin D [Legionella wadsworthii]|uniref:Hemolysin D n=1 Tax=Legionella wadsworthii TaxID=28088 RepID=A0A378LXF0_9GAMM|nr:HlyD family efflux transporter periplasmic adaptor subunit [Legionella wadsworthii]STY31007.1 hemolysin D [Legionella wadsworthii]